MSDGRITRPLTAEEACLAAAAERICFADAWDTDSIRSEIESPLGLYMGIWIDGAFAGYCGTRLVLDEGEIHRVAVLPEYRRRGLGAALLKALFAQTPEIVMWNLEVREGNLAARQLYSGFGFRQIGVRRNYYHDPLENGINMQWIRETE